MTLGPVLLGYTLVATFSAFRAFAVCNRNWFIFAIVLVIGLVPSCLQLSLLAHSQVSLGFMASPPFLYALATRLPVILAECIVVLLTWRKTYSASRSSLRRPSNVAAYLLRDGTLYFLAMMTIQVVQIIILIHPTIGSLGAFLDTIPPILVGRFIMHLSRIGRAPAPAEYTTSEAGQPLTSAVSLSAPSAWFVDELGGELDHALEKHEPSSESDQEHYGSSSDEHYGDTVVGLDDIERISPVRGGILRMDGSADGARVA
ncbi:uncharacterized protein PHACADRAFT_212746 [Phanerochaete carnosa HHB-10118-sp]|uniref:Uncharacterized protein n=1 Tax=Phanerochaete carnosa (strain HHB-10118-sp) TaxID=650164 RepID=K5UQR3_PHACS|nr:uncharacterized protein PHACADRAFT_212746 [Phanerochaete carnosa HHB-10118-sp]EKM52176.1 hypothetical protein PHACADRAFT_212746 [Phanerochaete carnosa HHB-10118-sp]